MAHGITNTDKVATTWKNGRAWHKLDEELEEGLDFQTAFERYGLGWKTELAVVEATLATGTKIALPDHRAHVRCDNGFVLGVVSNEYKPFENQDVARFADNILGEDRALAASTLGSLYGGRRIFCSAVMPRDIEVVDGDQVKGYIIFSNGHGGFAGFNSYYSTVRPLCDNTLTMSERDLASGISFRHTGNLDEKIKQARLILGLAAAEHERFEKSARALVKAQLSVGQVRAFMESAWVECFGTIDASNETAVIKATTKRDETIAKWIDNMEAEQALVPAITGTAWAAFNAVTKWHDHQRGRFLSVEQSSARLHSNLFGVSNRDKQKVFRKALALV